MKKNCPLTGGHLAAILSIALLLIQGAVAHGRRKGLTLRRK